MRTSTTRSLSSTPPWRTRRVASLLALAGALACPRRAPLPPPAELEILVALGVGLPRVTLGGEGGGELLLSAGEPLGSIPPGASWTVLPDSAGVRLLRPDGILSAPYPQIAAVNLTEGRFAIANSRRYRGRVHIARTAGAGLGLTVVNRVPLESYVAAVIGTEMGRRRDDEREALRAQAILSRTIALRSRGRWEALGFDVHGDTRDQVYGGVASENPGAWEATRHTVGLVLMHGGELIEGFFHSTCGFSTAGAEEAFRGSRGRPYLRPVSDRRNGGSYYCDISPRFRWREEWDAARLRAILSRTLPAVMNVGGEGGGLQRVTDLEVSRTTRSGRVGELRIVFDRGDVRVPGSDVRQVLRPEADRWLGSAAFQLHVTREGGGGQVARVVAAGAGWGHGVGLCQWGAVGRARAGQDFRRILATYFPGTSVERLY